MTIALERKPYQVIEGEGEVEVCATLNSTYDVECAMPSDFHIHIASSGMTGDKIIMVYTKVTTNKRWYNTYI